MATLTIRELDDALKAKLRIRAAQHGRSMEAEVRSILRSVLSSSSPTGGMGTRIQQRAASLDDTTLPLPERNEAPRAAELPE